MKRHQAALAVAGDRTECRIWLVASHPNVDGAVAGQPDRVPAHQDALRQVMAASRHATAVATKFCVTRAIEGAFGEVERELRHDG